MIFVFPTSSQKDEKKDAMKAEGIEKNVVSTGRLAKFMSYRQINVAPTFAKQK